MTSDAVSSRRKVASAAKGYQPGMLLNQTKGMRFGSKVHEHFEKITWLDELHDLADQLPDPEDVVVTKLTAGTRTRGDGGRVTVDGYTRKSEQISQVRKSLRTGGREVISGGGQEDERRAKYRWHFFETVMIEPRDLRADLDRAEPAARSDDDKNEPKDDQASAKDSKRKK